MELKTNALLDLQCDIKRFSDILDANNIALTEIAQLQQQLQSGKPLTRKMHLRNREVCVMSDNPA
ncbi:MAG: hypothetical protein ACP5T7_05210, partial [bacterium]